MDNKTLIIILVAGVALVGGGIFVWQKGKGQEELKGFEGLENLTGEEQAEKVLEEAQKTLEEQTGGQEGAISFEKTIGKDEEVTVKFMMHDYSNVPDDPESLQETKESLIPLEGQASFKVKEVGTVDEIDEFHQAGEGKTFHYIIYEFKGDASNPKGATIHPTMLAETGWDPAPQFVTIVDGDDKYPSSGYAHGLLTLKGYDVPIVSNVNFTTTEWSIQAAVWKVDQGTTPTYAFKYIDTAGNPRYFKLNL
jgi:hypothetical protein